MNVMYVIVLFLALSDMRFCFVKMKKKKRSWVDTTIQNDANSMIGKEGLERALRGEMILMIDR